MTDERWRSPLSTRYASPAMQTLWGEARRISLWRRLWLALAEAATTMATGGSAHHVVRGYRKKVRANAKRLRRTGRG